MLHRLSKYDNVLREVDFLEDLQSERGLQEVICEIDRFCAANEIIGFHFTRAHAEDILKQGLLARSGKDIRREFLCKHSNPFTKTELETIEQSWKRGFDETDERSRDHRIFLNFTLDALKNGGAEPLLKNFGGEQVYAPLQNLPEIGQKIRNIGTPLIVKCRLDPNKVSTFIQHPWGMIAVSTYHRTQNLAAGVIDQDGYQATPVPAQHIEIIYFERSDEFET